MSTLAHARAIENKLENVNPTFFKFRPRFWRAVFILLNFSHRLIASKVLYKESFYGDYRRSFFASFFKLFALGILIRGFTVPSYQRPLYCQRINDSYSTMSDGILDRIFLIVHRTFLFSYFRGCCIALGFFFCASSMWTYNGAAIELAAAVFIKRLPQNCHEFRETKLLAKETL